MLLLLVILLCMRLRLPLSNLLLLLLRQWRLACWNLLSSGWRSSCSCCCCFVLCCLCSIVALRVNLLQVDLHHTRQFANQLLLTLRLCTVLLLLLMRRLYTLLLLLLTGRLYTLLIVCHTLLGLHLLLLRLLGACSSCYHSASLASTHCNINAIQICKLLFKRSCSSSGECGSIARTTTASSWCWHLTNTQTSRPAVAAARCSSATWRRRATPWTTACTAAAPCCCCCCCYP
jgi:hypothetical protein